MSTDRKIKFLSRNLPFPVDPTFREYRVIQDLTGVTAQDIMTGEAGIWMLPVLAIVALLRADHNVSRASLEKILDLNPTDITLEGDFNDPPETAVEMTAPLSTGTPSTLETHEESGIPDSPTSFQARPESQMT